ncbi:Protein NETWORKED 1A [Zea mays]|uniref:Protein NETWORKED 1A n=3 Tax=Zea mays TaxID=4577 RepID=A0A1D6GQI9_MAIZE|nr:Protein NETWORKED 1A [Zea mays]
MDVAVATGLSDEPQQAEMEQELDETEQEVQLLTQDLEKKKEAENVHFKLQDECHRRMQIEATLLMTEGLHSQLQEEMKTLTQDFDGSKKKLSELENNKLDLESTLKELKNIILGLNSEKDATLLQQQQSLDKVSDLELELSKMQLEMEKSEQKILLLEQEIARETESVDSLEVSFKDECEKRLQAQTSLVSLEKMYCQSQEDVRRLQIEIEKQNDKLNELENLSSELNNTILLVNTEKDATLHENQQSLARISDLESELMALKTELENVERKVHMIEQELIYKKEEADNLQISLQDETQKRVDGETSLLMMKNLHSESQNEVRGLALELEKLNGNLRQVENSKVDLENIVTKHTEEIHILREQNLSTELMIKDLHLELDVLKDLNVKLQAEMDLHKGEKEVLQREFTSQREEKENLEGIHHTLVDEMDTLKTTTTMNQKLIEELQITNLKLKEVCARSEVEKALLSEKTPRVGEHYYIGHESTRRYQERRILHMINYFGDCLVDEQDKKAALFTECQKYAVENHSANMLVSQLMGEARYHGEERKTLLKHNEKLWQGISKQMKVLNICKDLAPADLAEDEVLLQTVLDETINTLRLKDETEDVNRLMNMNSAVYEEKTSKLMMNGKATETRAISLKELLMKEVSSRDAHIEELQKKLAGIQDEHAELNAELNTYLALVASLADHVSVLEEDCRYLSKPCSTEDKEETACVHHVQEGNDGLESHCLPKGTPELQGLIARIEALQVVVSNAKDRQDQESAESAAKLAAVSAEIQDLKARGGSRMEGKEIYSDHEKQDVEISKGKQVQIMKDIELDQISTCPPYGARAALYPLGTGANAKLDDDMLQLWEAAERICKNQTAKSSSSEHDIQAVEDLKSEHPSSELARGRDLGINKLEASKGAAEPHEAWSKNVHETEGHVLEQINLNNKLTRTAENYPTLSDNMSTEREGYSSRRKISEQVQKGSENVARLELELQKIQYVLLKLEEEHEYRRLKVSDKRTRVLLRDYLCGRKDRGGGQKKKKKRVPFCCCVRPKSRTEP